MNDSEKIFERTRLYESVVPIEVINEVSREDYLRRLTMSERQSIAYLFKSFNTLFRATTSLMALAVGTTTFNKQYWNGLRDYLQINDPSKLDYVDRRGEDIDIIICNDDIWQPDYGTFAEWMNFARKDLDKAGIDYVFEDGVREGGTSYLTVPDEYRLQEGQGVIRQKIRDYSDSLKIFSPNSRDIHLSFNYVVGEVKLKQERINDNPFSLLFRHTNRYSLVSLIDEINKDNL